VAWVTVIILMALMTVWAAKESASAAAFIGSCLFLLIVVPLVTRSSKR
jgi:quinol-cytochrome oxidoreductase complex cytochrome b subunit